MANFEHLRKIYSKYTTEQLFKFIILEAQDFEPEALEIIKEEFNNREGEISNFIQNEIEKTGLIECEIDNATYFYKKKEVTGKLFLTSKGIYFIPIKLKSTYLEYSFGIDIEDIDSIKCLKNGYLNIHSIANRFIQIIFDKDNVEQIDNWIRSHMMQLEKEKTIAIKNKPLSFKIGKLNSILVIAACIASIMYFIFQKSFTSLELWYLFGFCSSFILWPFILSWILWRIAKRNNSVGKVAFFIILLLIIFINTLRLINNYQGKSATRKIKSITSELDKIMINDLKEDGQFDSNTRKKLEKYSRKAFQSIPTRTYEEKVIKMVTQEYISHFYDLVQKWNEAEKKCINELSSFLVINSRKEINKKINIIKEYQESSTKIYEFTIKNGGKNLCKKKLRDKGISAERIDDFIIGLDEPMADIKDISDRLFNARFKFIDSVLNVLYFLDKNFGRWEYSYNTNKIIFYDDSLLNKFNELINIIAQNEDLMEKQRKLIYISCLRKITDH